MKIYLAQHGRCTSEQEDPAKPLTKQGENDSSKIARFLKRAGIIPSKIIHSGKLRAKQTAVIFSKHLDVQAVEQTDGIAPMDDPQKLLGMLEDGLMVVGHLPHLSNAAHAMIGAKSVRFTYSGVLCLEESEKNWVIKWYITPELITSL